VVGQPFPVAAIGTNLPPELTSGSTYYLSRTGTNTFTIHSQPAGSWDGVTGKIIPSSAGTLANWGFRYLGASNDHTAMLADMQRGTEWLAANGFSRGARHYAPNQGAWDIYSERAFFLHGGFDTCNSITINSAPIASGASSSMPVFDPAHFHAVPADTVSQIYATLHASWMNIPNSVNTDSAGSGRGSAAIRGWVQKCVAQGQVFSNYHHGASLTTNLDLLYYLDELKLWYGRGMLDVLKISDIWARCSQAKASLTA